jgi:hypothetical protein
LLRRHGLGAAIGAIVVTAARPFVGPSAVATLASIEIQKPGQCRPCDCKQELPRVMRSAQRRHRENAKTLRPARDASDGHRANP